MSISAISPGRARRALVLVSLVSAGGCPFFGRPRDEAAGPPRAVEPSWPRRRSPAPAPRARPPPRPSSTRASTRGRRAARPRLRRARAPPGRRATTATAATSRPSPWRRSPSAGTTSTTCPRRMASRHRPRPHARATAARALNGPSVGGDAHHLIETSKEPWRRGLARYDALAGPEAAPTCSRPHGRADPRFQPDGALQTSDRRFPVETGPMQATTQAMQTWRQASSARPTRSGWHPALRREAGSRRRHRSSPAIPRRPSSTSTTRGHRPLRRARRRWRPPWAPSPWPAAHPGARDDGGLRSERTIQRLRHRAGRSARCARSAWATTKIPW